MSIIMTLLPVAAGEDEAEVIHVLKTARTQNNCTAWRTSSIFVFFIEALFVLRLRMHLLWHIYTVSCTIIYFHAWISRAILCNLPADFPACCSSIRDCSECLNAIVLCLLVRQSYMSNCKYSEGQLHVYRSWACTLYMYMYIVIFVPSVQWNRNGISVRHINDFLFQYRRHKLL